MKVIDEQRAERERRRRELIGDVDEEAQTGGDNMPTEPAPTHLMPNAIKFTPAAYRSQEVANEQ